MTGRDHTSWHLMIALAAAQVVAGGLVAAVTGPLELTDGSWLAAYLVLVGGVSQYVMGRAGLWNRGVDARLGWAALVGWNLGNALVVVGTLTDWPYGVDVGGVVLVVAILASGWGVLRSGRDSEIPGWARAAYLFVLVVLVVSIPIGAVLGHARS